jgi:hypothetical protein
MIEGLPLCDSYCSSWNIFLYVYCMYTCLLYIYTYFCIYICIYIYIYIHIYIRIFHEYVHVCIYGYTYSIIEITHYLDNTEVTVSLLSLFDTRRYLFVMGSIDFFLCWIKRILILLLLYYYIDTNLCHCPFFFHTRRYLFVMRLMNFFLGWIKMILIRLLLYCHIARGYYYVIVAPSMQNTNIHEYDTAVDNSFFILPSFLLSYCHN